MSDWLTIPVQFVSPLWVWLILLIGCPITFHLGCWLGYRSGKESVKQ